jgi:hypothetical protein
MKLIRQLTALFALALVISSSANGAVIEVYPTGDPEYDVVNIQDAIDSANEYDVISLKAGLFVLGKETQEDDLIKYGNYDFYLREAFWWMPLPGCQNININKPLNVRGEVDTNGELITRISVAHTGEDVLYCSFLVNAESVTVRDLKFEGFYNPVMAFSPGFDISGNTFSGSDLIRL